MPLPWLPSKLLSDVNDWSFTNTATQAMHDLSQMGQQVMQPALQQVKDVVASTLPAPPQAPAPRSVVPSVPSFSLGKIEDWLTPTPAPRPTAQAAPSEAPPPELPAPPDTKPAGLFSLPSLESFLGAGAGAQPAAAAAAPSVAPGPAPAPATAPQPGGDLRAYARGVAQRYGVDPGIFERQITQESGFDPKAVSAVGAQGIAQFMPATAKGVGLADPFEPYSALDAAARHMADNLKNNGGDYARALAAYNAGQGNVNAHGGVPPFAETQQYVRAILGDARPTAGAPPDATARQITAPDATSESRPSPATTGPSGVPTAVAEGAGWRQTWGKDLTPNQIKETLNLGLSWDAALATCGIAASIAFARANGRTPTFKEALDLAQRTGEWNADVGMTRGTSGQLALLKGLGVDATARPLAEAEVASAVTSGQPVQINAHGSGGHFYVAQGYDPQTRKFDFGNSAAILKRSGGNTWYRLDELPSLGVGTPTEAIYLAGGR